MITHDEYLKALELIDKYHRQVDAATVTKTAYQKTYATEEEPARCMIQIALNYEHVTATCMSLTGAQAKELFEAHKGKEPVYLSAVMLEGLSIKNLRYYLPAAYDHGITGHPDEDMKKRGITWKRFIGQPIGDQIWYLGCENIPDVLPEYITLLPDGQC